LRRIKPLFGVDSEAPQGEVDYAIKSIPVTLCVCIS
jgi:hypothetical protein